MTAQLDWTAILRSACDATSQARVGRRLRDAGGDSYPSDSVVSQVLAGKYPGRTERLRALVEGVYGGVVVACPMLGNLPLHECIGHQVRPFATTNPQRVALYRACRGGCPHSRLEEQT